MGRERMLSAIPLPRLLILSWTGIRDENWVPHSRWLGNVLHSADKELWFSIDAGGVDKAKIGRSKSANVSRVGLTIRATVSAGGVAHLFLHIHTVARRTPSFRRERVVGPRSTGSLTSVRDALLPKPLKPLVRPVDA